MRDSETPGEEFRVAAAGPAVTLLLTLVFGARRRSRCSATRCCDAATFDFASGTLLEVVVAFTALANAALFVLNMVPAFPLDGGRIARADRLAAQRRPPQGDAVLRLPRPGLRRADDGLRRLPLRSATGDAVDGLWWIVLGWMLGGAARAAVAQSDFADRLEGVTAGDIMDSEPVTIPADLPVERAYDEFFLRYQGWPWFAVVEDDGRFAGLAHRAAVEHAALQEDAAQPVRDVVADSEQVRTDTPLESLIGIRAAAHARRADGRRRRRPPARRRDASSRSRARFRRACAVDRLTPKAIVRACPHTTC